MRLIGRIIHCQAQNISKKQVLALLELIFYVKETNEETRKYNINI